MVLLRMLLWSCGWWLEGLVCFLGGCQGVSEVVARGVVVVLWVVAKLLLDDC